MSELKIGYVNIFTSDIKRAISFFTDTIGLTLNQGDEEFGYASFQAGTITLGIAQTDDTSLLGRHTGVGFMVEDIEQAYQRLVTADVDFEMVPTKQPWGGTLALFLDPDRNIFYLDPGHHH